jgi:CelD/BcsL family acetyltransferase involved in cellulose biosynthesis
MRFLADHGWLRFYILYISDSPCAFLSGQLYNKTFYCQYLDYHPEFASFSVGSVLTAQVFQNLATGGVERIDLGEGGQEHNRRLGCQMSEEATVHVYSPSIRGLWLNIFFGVAHAARASGRLAQSHLGLSRAGKYWRRYLFSNWRSANSQSGPARQACLTTPQHNQKLI